MKLAVLVVYFADRQHAPLITLHLDRLARHTRSPYTVYGTANRLPSSLRPLLDRPEVSIVEVEPTDARGAVEHSYYLEALVRRAIADGATHLVTLHVDSFPVADGWDETLVSMTATDAPFVSIDRVSTACLFFTREFWLEQHPALLLDADGNDAEQVKRFASTEKAERHSGFGYAYTAWCAGQEWLTLPRTASSPDPNGSAIFANMLFHLGGAVRLLPVQGAIAPQFAERSGYRLFRMAIRPIRRLWPSWIKRTKLHARLAALLQNLDDRWKARGMRSDLEQLLADPDRFIDWFRVARDVERA